MADRRATHEVLAAAATAPAQILGVALGVTAVFVEFHLLTLQTLAVLAVPASTIVGLLVTALAP